jgi:hypothetical protein
MSAGRRQIHLAAHFPGVNNTTVWSDPAAGSHIDFDSFVHLAQTAERAKFDFFFLAEGLRMREHAGALHELDVAGRPDNMTVLAALAAVTERLGLVPTITSTYHEESAAGDHAEPQDGSGDVPGQLLVKHDCRSFPVFSGSGCVQVAPRCQRRPQPRG